MRSVLAARESCPSASSWFLGRTGFRVGLLVLHDPLPPMRLSGLRGSLGILAGALIHAALVGPRSAG